MLMKKNLKILKSHMKSLINVSSRLPNEGIFSLFKVVAAYEIIEHSEKYIFSKDKNPVPEVMRLIDIFKDIFKRLIILSSREGYSQNKGMKDISRMNMSKEEIGDITKQVYGDLWKGFSKEKFHNETLKSLTDRLKRNNIDITWFKGKTCLDAGCGGGRYTVALSGLGTKKVIGIDISEEALSDARKRIKALNIKNTYFRKGNVLKIPFSEKSFDFVLSNGVLHHTVNPEKGISEISRVLRKNGKIFLYLEGKGGLYWELFSLGRKLLKSVSKEKSVLTLKAIGLAGNRIFFFIDPLYVLIQNWVTPEKVEAWLTKYGFINITRLYKGTDYDRNEYLFNPRKRHRYSTLIHGLGQLRYMAEKNNNYRGNCKCVMINY